MNLDYIFPIPTICYSFVLSQFVSLNAMNFCKLLDILLFTCSGFPPLYHWDGSTQLYAPMEFGS